MRAEDTVLSDKEAIEIIKQFRDVKPNQVLPYYWHREAQAGISFKAGREEGINFAHRQFDANLPEIMEGSKQTGIREVVEWIEKHSWLSSSVSGYDDYGFNEIPWQTQKKEWGIE